MAKVQVDEGSPPGCGSNPAVARIFSAVPREGALGEGQISSNRIQEGEVKRGCSKDAGFWRPLSRLQLPQHGLGAGAGAPPEG